MLAVDARLGERFVQQASGRPDKGQAFLVLLVARLLADQHHARVRVAGVEHRLRRVGPERAVLAAERFLAQLLQGLCHRSLECPG